MPNGIAPLLWKDRTRRRRLRARNCQSAPPYRGMAAEDQSAKNQASENPGSRQTVEARTTPVGQSIRRKVRCWTNSMFQSDSSSDSDYDPSPEKYGSEVKTSTVLKSLGRLPLANSSSDPPMESRVLAYGSALDQDEDDQPPSPYPTSPPQNHGESTSSKSKQHRRRVARLYDAAADTENISPNAMGSGKTKQNQLRNLSPLQQRSPNIVHAAAPVADSSPPLSPATSPPMLAALQQTPPTIPGGSRDMKLFMKLARSHCFDSSTDASEQMKDHSACGMAEALESPTAELLDSLVDEVEEYSETNCFTRRGLVPSTPLFLHGAHPPQGLSSPFVLPLSPSFSFGSIGGGSDPGQETCEIEAFGTENPLPASPAMASSTQFLPVSQRSLQTAALSEGSARTVSAASQPSSMSLAESVPGSSPAMSEVSIQSSFPTRLASVQASSPIDAPPFAADECPLVANGPPAETAQQQVDGPVADSALFTTVDLSSTTEDAAGTGGPLKDLLDAAETVDAVEVESRASEQPPVAPADLETLRHFLDALPVGKQQLLGSAVMPFSETSQVAEKLQEARAVEHRDSPDAPGSVPLILFKPSRIPRFTGSSKDGCAEHNGFEGFEADVEKLLESFDISCSATPVKEAPLTEDVLSAPGTPMTPGMTFISPNGLDCSLDLEEDNEELFRLTQLLDSIGRTRIDEMSSVASPSVFDVAVELSGVSLASTPSPATAFSQLMPGADDGASTFDECHTPLPDNEDVFASQADSLVDQAPIPEGVFSPQSQSEASLEGLPRTALDFEDVLESLPPACFLKRILAGFFFALCFSAASCLLVFFAAPFLSSLPPSYPAMDAGDIRPPALMMPSGLSELAAELDELVNMGQLLSMGVLPRAESEMCSLRPPLAPHWQSFHEDDTFETPPQPTVAPNQVMVSVRPANPSSNETTADILVSTCEQSLGTNGTINEPFELIMGGLDASLNDGASLGLHAPSESLGDATEKASESISSRVAAQPISWQSLMTELDELVAEGEQLGHRREVPQSGSVVWLPEAATVRRVAVEFGMKASLAALLARAGRWMIPMPR